MSHLPTEILASVISQGFAEEADLVFLWTVLRNVDRRFRALVDSYVRKNHLKRTYITYRIPDSIGPGPSTNVEIWLRSAGVDPQDLATAIFVYDDVMSTLPGDVLGGFGAIREELRQHPLDDWLCPAHVLSVGRYVNDTELCGFEVVDCSREGERTGGFEVRIDWRMTFTRLLFEEKGRQGMSRRWLQEQRARSSGLHEKPLHDLHHAVRLHLFANRGARDESYSRARWRRIIKLFKQQGQEVLRPGERPGRADERRARLKLEMLEGHLGFMNQFCFD